MFSIAIKLIKICLYIMKHAIKVMSVHNYFVNCFSSKDIYQLQCYALLSGQFDVKMILKLY